MKATYTPITLAAAALVMLAPGCSQNLNSELEPVQREKTLSYDVESSGFDPGRDLLSFDAASNTATVKVTSNTRWTVEVADEGGWCSVDTYSGLGEGEFTISVKDNLRNEARQGTVTIRMAGAGGETFGSWPIYVSQAASSINITPQSVQTFPAEASETERNNAEFTIQSNVPWTLTVTFHETAAFLTVAVLEGNMAPDGGGGSGELSYAGSGEARFRIDIQNNRTAVDRRATLTLKGEGTVDSKTVEISQSRTANVFDVSPTESQLMGAEGGTREFGVISIFSWSVSCAADWITFTRETGESSDQRVPTTAIVAPNDTGFERSTQIWFTPDRNSGVEPISVWISQTGSRDPAISVPWLADGYGQTFATVLFNYFSPFVSVTEAGLQWRRDGDVEWESRSVAVTGGDTPDAAEGITVRGNALSGTVTVDLTGLDPAMDYVARGFVRDAGGAVVYGTATYPFRTAGKFPDQGDVPTPE